MVGERNAKWADATPYGRDTIQGEATSALELPKTILTQYREVAKSFASTSFNIMDNWPALLEGSNMIRTFWDKLDITQRRLFEKSRLDILSGKPYTIRFDSTVTAGRKIAIFEPEIQNCGDGPLIQKINEYGRDKTIELSGLMPRTAKYLQVREPVLVTRSKQNMTFYRPSIDTIALGLRISGVEAIPANLEDLEIGNNGVFWSPKNTSDNTQSLLTSPSWYKIKNQNTRINTVYNQLGTRAIFYPNTQEEKLFRAYCDSNIEIFPTPNPLIASKIVLCLIWDTQTSQIISSSSESARNQLLSLRKFTPESYLGSNNCPNACDILPAVVKPVFGAKQQGIKTIGLPYQLDQYRDDTNFVIQKYVLPYVWESKTRKGYGRFKTRLESFCWFERDKGEVLDFLATGSTSDIVGGNREGPMTTVYFK